MPISLNIWNCNTSKSSLNKSPQRCYKWKPYPKEEVQKELSVQMPLTSTLPKNLGILVPSKSPKHYSKKTLQGVGGYPKREFYCLSTMKRNRLMALWTLPVHDLRTAQCSPPLHGSHCLFHALLLYLYHRVVSRTLISVLCEVVFSKLFRHCQLADALLDSFDSIFYPFFQSVIKKKI